MAYPSIQQAMAIALQHHQAGRLHQAEQLYRQILAQQPNHAGALHYLGVIARQAGRSDIAVDLIRRSIALEPGDAEAHSNLGSVLKDKGLLKEAIAAYRQAIALCPNYAEAHNNLGDVLRDHGQLDQAIAACRQAILLRPNYSDAYCNLGSALRDRGQLDDAIAAFERATALAANSPEAHANLANALRDKGRLDEAIVACRRALALKPDFPEAYCYLGDVLQDSGRPDEAIAAYRQAIALAPDTFQAHNNIGSALEKTGRLDDAIAAYRQAISLRPHVAQARVNLGSALIEVGELDEAIAMYRQAIALRPSYAEAHSNLGNALAANGQLDQALPAHRQALTCNPKFPEAHSNLGNAFKERGQLDEALAAHRQALAIDPGNASIDSNLVYTLHFHPAYDAHAIAAEHRRWHRRHAEPLRKFIQSHPNDRTSDRRLQVGYVSPDFRDHVVGRNLLPLLLQHDRRWFEVICYSNVRRPDLLTSQFQQNADRWRNIVGISDEQAAEQIRADRIDILVDLTLHTAHNRLLVFARKPAPVQVTFAGYPGSTGLTAIDYRLSDPYLDPPGVDESIYSEKTIRLPDSFWCYDPLECAQLPVTPLPAMANGFVTFGCLNNFAKINAGVLALWAQVMRQVPGSRLLLLSHEGCHRQRTVDRLSQCGIQPDRIEFASPRPRLHYMALYHRIDIALDSFPYNGHTTSLDSFWMGVPVVTRVGNSAVSRAGWCQLSNLGLTELAAQTAEQFVAVAVKLAQDLPRLQELRSTLRQRMEHSPLMDAPRFARNIEAAYRQMWRTWCETASKS
jgi:predicted O-linked N-acetylglucosamine transferase (SPINDLY family)